MGKEIDSKSDLLEEETMAIPAEHRAYPDMDLSEEMSNNFLKKNILSSSTGISNKFPHATTLDPGQNDIWPMVPRSDASIIKVN